MTITVRLPPKLETRLRARLNGPAKLSAYVRDAIAEKLAREPAAVPSAYDLGKEVFGRHGSGRRDRSTRRKALLDEMLRVKHRR